MPGGATLTGPVFYTVVGRISAAPSGILLAKKSATDVALLSFESGLL
ncbi:hypothetical protein CKO_01516 [Citrobacter koseri ATCC BAA-895]|uniref:Uncharacterized protein n=1 Tax=Citrobacter koseri (strain ATCC BAA-895 / CDC 4225-83 / SGSC4696) TaxID=290338 RepID=A8AGN5_CITK8|nr:hypothetical protein CKO_01516 [Citrobacter koseri ATCC BAA-895]